MAVSPTTHDPTPEAAPTLTPRASQIARSTLIVMLAFGAAKALSLAQTFIIANVFGVGSEWDAYVTANRIPEQIFNLIAGGALGTAFLPMFAGLLAQQETRSAWRLASQVINTAFLAALVVSTISFIAAPMLVSQVVAPGFDAETVGQTVTLMRILLLSTMIFSVSGIVMGILQSYQNFLLPALAPILFDVGVLFGVAVLLPRFGTAGIAVGAVLGAGLHLGIQIPGLIHHHARWMPTLGWRDPALRRVVQLMLPRILDIGLFSLSAILINNIASYYQGANSAIDWGWRLMQIPETLIGTAMGTVIFPTLASLSALGDIEGKRRAMGGALRFIVAATLPSAVGLVLVGGPVVSLLERGAFDAEGAALVTSALRFFAFGIVVHSMLEVLARSFFADRDTWTPLFIALGGAAINILSALLLIGGVTGTSTVASPQVVGGLALANTLGVTFEVTLLLFFLRRRWHGVEGTALARTAAKAALASVVMGVAIVILEALWGALGLNERGLAFTVAQIGVEVVAGALVFVGTAALLRMEEIGSLWRLITTRFRPSGAAAL